MTFLRVFDLARDAALIRVGQQDEVTAGQDDVRCDTGAFGADGTFGHLHDDVRAGRIKARNVFLRRLGAITPAAFAFDNFNPAVEAARDDIPIMQKRIFLETDVDESGFEAVFEIAYFALENAADEPFFGGAFDVKFFEFAFFENAHAGLKNFRVDNDFFVNAFYGFNETLHLFDERTRCGADAAHDAFWLFFNLNRGEGFFFLNLGRSLEIGFAEIPLGIGLLFRRFDRSSFRRQTCGDIFVAFDFVCVALVKKFFLRRRPANGFGASL